MMRAMKATAMTSAGLVAGLVATFVPAAEPAQPASGEAVYTRWCTHCHSAGRGNPGTDSLQVKYGGKIPAVLLERSDLSPQAVAQFVRTGVLSMPPFRKTEVSDAELAAVSAYVAQKFPKP
jgi:mono/diheme cytochrome c family protein